MSPRVKVIAGTSERRKRRDAALNARQARSKPAKQEGAFRARFEESEVLARILVSKHGLGLSRARWLVARASPLPDMLHKRGQPPTSHELYEGVESTREKESGQLPIRRGVAFWPSFTKQWNAVNFEHPERQFVTMAGKPNWRGLRAAYRVAKRLLELKAAALFKAQKKTQ